MAEREALNKIVNFQPKTKNKTTYATKQTKEYNAELSRQLRKSSFNILINTNAGYKNFDAQGRIELVNRLNTAKSMIQSGLADGSLRIPHAKYNAKLTKIVGFSEIGDQKGHVHMHLFVQFDDFTHIDQPKFQAVMRHIMHPLVPYVKIRYVKDTASVAEWYASKSGQDFTQNAPASNTQQSQPVASKVGATQQFTYKPQELERFMRKKK